MNSKSEKLLAYATSQPNHFGRYLSKKPDLYVLVKDQPGASATEQTYNFFNPGAYTASLQCKTCKAVKCDFISFTKGYRSYCSNKCSSNDPNVIAKMIIGLHTEESKKKREQSMIEKYGTNSSITLNREKANETRRSRAKSDYWNMVPIPGSTDERDGIYVYGYFNPTKPMSEQTRNALNEQRISVACEHEIFYVGYGTKNRAHAHLHIARKSCEDSHKLNTIRGLWRDSKEPIIKILQQVETMDKGLELEAKLIGTIGTVEDIEGVSMRGPLTNLDKGGRGGFKGGELTREKLRKSREGKMWITKNDKQLFVAIEDLAKWEADEWCAGVRESARRSAYMTKISETMAELKWITDGEVNKRVKDPAPWLLQGWKVGITSNADRAHARNMMWITNDIESKKIMKTDAIPDGWRHGRIRPKFANGYKKQR